MSFRQTDFKFEGLTNFYRGKVRDVYTLSDSLLIMVVTDRISAFDAVLPEPIPYKGQVLNQTSAYFLGQSISIIPNWILSVPDPNVSIGLKCKPIALEMVVRGYLSGHAWRLYQSGKREICGVHLPDNLKENDQLPHPILTPSTKAEVGHDEDISKIEILNKNLVSDQDLEKIENYAFSLFNLGTRLAAEKGIILVDTKYEFGYFGKEIYLMDEIHTPDSSRYFYADTYAELQAKGAPQRQLSKEFVREWLMENGFQGLAGQSVPVMNSKKVDEISKRYIELYEKITGLNFQKPKKSDREKEIYQNILQYLDKKEQL